MRLYEDEEIEYKRQINNTYGMVLINYKKWTCLFLCIPNT